MSPTVLGAVLSVVLILCSFFGAIKKRILALSQINDAVLNDAADVFFAVLDVVLQQSHMMGNFATCVRARRVSL